MSPPLRNVSDSAQNYGLDFSPIDTTKVDCAQSPQDKPSYEYCDLKQLEIQLTAPGKSKTITLDSVRRYEPVDASTAPCYREILGERDLVIEVLADIRDKVSHDWGKTEHDSKDNRPLTINAKAQNACAHTSFAPRHPVLTLDTMNGGFTLTEAGAPIREVYSSAHPGAFFNSGIAGIWPFSGARTKAYTVKAMTCGNLPIPMKVIDHLSAEIYVLPYEEWVIKIGLGPRASGGTSTTQNYKGEKDGDSGRKVVRKTIVMKQEKDRQVTTTTELMRTRTEIERTRVIDETTSAIERGNIGKARELGYDVLGPKAQAIQVVEEDWRSQTRWVAPTPEQEYRKVSITHKVAGQEVETDVNETIKSLFEFKSLLDKLKKIFDSVKFGASFSTEYELFSGSLSFSWGNAWPLDYKEYKRVYYVQHFITGTGTCNLFDAKVTGFCGLAVKSPTSLVDVAVEIGGYISVAIKTPVTVTIDHRWAKEASEWTGKLDCNPSFNLEGGFKANGRAFGYSVEGRIALEYAVAFALAGEISTRHPLTIKSSLIFGKEIDESTDDNPDYAAVRLVAELKMVGSSLNTWKIKPYVLLNGAVAWKDYYLVGEKPKD